MGWDSFFYSSWAIAIPEVVPPTVRVELVIIQMQIAGCATIVAQVYSVNNLKKINSCTLPSFKISPLISCDFSLVGLIFVAFSYGINRLIN